MRLTPQELDKLTLHQAGVLAQKRLARGLRLNHPEAVALLATQLLELIRDGHSVSELMSLGKRVLGLRHVLPGVASLIPEVQVEGTFLDGSKLVTVHHPICDSWVDLRLALHGSFLPLPAEHLFPALGEADDVPGAVDVAADEVVLNAGRPALTLQVTNTGDRPVQVGSHFPFVETNRALRFDRRAAVGRRLDIPAGTAVRFEPGETRAVHLVAIGGRGVVRGGNGLSDGAASADEVLERAQARGFLHRGGGQ